MLLSWDKPKKAMTTEEWKGLSADGAPPGVYTPNMSTEDMNKWRAKKVSGSDPRVEVRKTTDEEIGADYFRSQVVLIVRKDTVVFSSNGKAAFNTDELLAAITEARQEL